MANKRGPKRKHLSEIDELVTKLKEYIDNNDIPIIAEFAYLNDIPRSSLYDQPELSTLLKKLICKKEANLEKGILSNQINTAGGIFSLKQLGWKDRQTIELENKFDEYKAAFDKIK